MPCYGPEPTQAEIEASWEQKLRHNSPTAQAFCDLCNWLEKHNCAKLIEDVPLASAWWEEHKRRDRERAQVLLENAKMKSERETLLARLTPYEKSLLGLR